MFLTAIRMESLRFTCKTKHKFVLKQRLYFLLEHNKKFDDFLDKILALNVQMDVFRK